MRTAFLCALALAMVMPASAQTGAATVEFEDQSSDGTWVNVEQVTLSNGGFIVIHADNNGSAGQVLGWSEYLSVGTHDDVRVNITMDMQGNDTFVVFAMPHFDTNDNEEFDFVSSGGQDDGPYMDGGVAQTESATITVESTGTDTDTVGAGREDDGDEDAPGFEVIAVLAALAAALFLLGRRRA